jgi:hypothetical protein
LPGGLKIGAMPFDGPHRRFRSLLAELARIAAEASLGKAKKSDLYDPPKDKSPRCAKTPKSWARRRKRRRRRFIDISRNGPKMGADWA